MADVKISAGTLTTPLLSDWVPLSRPDDTTPRKATVATLGMMQSATVAISQSALTTLNSTPVEVVPAPGEDLIIVPISATFQYVAGAVSLQVVPIYQNINIGLSWYNNQNTIAFFDYPLDPSSVSTAEFLTGTAPLSEIVNAPLVFFASQDFGMIGAISSWAIDSGGQGGSGYSIGDTGTLQWGPVSVDGQTFLNAPTYVVTAVDDSGAATTVTLDNLSGPGPSASIRTQTGGDQPGSGDGSLVIEVTVDPGTLQTGTGQINVVYTVIPAAG